MLNFRLPLAISLGAIAGALTRYYVNLWFVRHYGTGFPYGILAINMTGCCLMGLIATLTIDRTVFLSPEMYSLLTTGFLGAFYDFFYLWTRHSDVSTRAIGKFSCFILVRECDWWHY